MAIGIFLFCIYAAIKETVKAKVSPQYKVAVAVGIAGFEWGIYWLVGVNPEDPKIVDVIAVSSPLVGVAAGFWGYSAANA